MNITASILFLLLIILFFWPQSRQMYQTVTKKAEEPCPAGFEEATTNLCTKA